MDRRTQPERSRGERDAPLHVVFATSEYVGAPPAAGGLASRLRKVAVELTRRGHRVSVLVLRDQDDERRDGDVYVRQIRRWRAPRGSGRTWVTRTFLPPFAQFLSARRLARELWRLHQRDPVDLIETSNYQAPGVALLDNGEVPVVCRIAAYTPLLRATNGQRKTLRSQLTDWLDIRQILDADAIFAPSYAHARIVTRLEGRECPVVRTPPTLTDTELDPTFHRANLAGASYLLYFGTLDRRKGIDQLAMALPPILDRHRELLVVFIGRDHGMLGHETAMGYVRERCARHAERIRYYEALPPAQLLPVVDAALGVVLPTRDDNYPNAALEALATGTPVVGFAGSGLEEVVNDGDTGFLATGRTPDGLADAIERLLSIDAAERRRMHDRIRRWERELLDQDPVGELVAFYEQVIADFRRSTS